MHIYGIGSLLIPNSTQRAFGKMHKETAPDRELFLYVLLKTYLFFCRISEG